MTRSPFRRLVFGTLRRLLYLWVRSETINQSSLTLNLDRSRPVFYVLQSPSLTELAVVDAAGNAVSMTTTNNLLELKGVSKVYQRGLINAQAKVAQAISPLKKTLRTTGKINFPVEVEVSDASGHTVARMRVTWNLKKN